MNNKLDANLVKRDNSSDTQSVTTIIVNTHCIVCGMPFQVPRMSKLYCSTRCKQYGYNHKNEIIQALSVRNKGINQKEMIFFIDDYSLYEKKQRMLKRYWELEKKRLQWELANQEIQEKQKLDLPISNYLLNSYISHKLTNDEEGELYNIETELEERILSLKPKELSLEQWSFIKSLHPSLDEITLFELTASLSVEFIRQLNLSATDSKINDINIIIKNKFVNHCNLIANGIIKFLKRADEEN